MVFELPKLDYDYNALEPHIDEETVRIHHDKHHQGYVDKLNKTVEGTEWADKDINVLLASLDEVSAEIRTAVRNFGGGVANHNLYWKVIGPNAGGMPTGKLAEAINAKFGGFDKFKEEFSNAAKSFFGSGWAWLVLNNGELEIVTTSNQDSPVGQGKIPILTCDVWEHAYYLKYKNKRPDYVEAFWNLINWDEVSRRFEEAQ